MIWFLKKYLRLVLLIELVTVLSVAEINAQDALFSQYFASGVYFNPSLAATETSLTLSGITRTQWRSVGAAYQTSMVAVTVPFKDKFEKHKRLAGITLSYYDDKSADKALHTQGLNATLGYGLSLTEKNILFVGGTFGWYNKRVDYSNFNWGGDLNNSIGGTPDVGQILLDNTNYIDFNAGFLAIHDLGKKVGVDISEIYFGGAFYHINSPNESLIDGQVSNLPLRMNFNLGALLPIKEHIGVSPNVLYVAQGGGSQLNLGLYGTYYFLEQDGKGVVPNNIEVGSWYRLGDSFIVTAGIGNEVYHLGFSYDMTTSNLRYSSGGNSAYEISFKLQKPHKRTERHVTPRF